MPLSLYVAKCVALFCFYKEAMLFGLVLKYIVNAV